MSFTGLSRRAVMALGGNRPVASLITRYGMALGAGRFVAGLDAPATLEAVSALNQHGLLATVDHLGESVTSPAGARAAAGVYVELLDEIAATRVQSNVSLKLTQLGLDIDQALVEENMRLILDRAAARDNFVRIDMEDSPRTQQTLDLFGRLLADYGPRRVGVVLQSYLYRTEQDIRELAARGANLRLCKGAYAEPAAVAFARKADVDRAFLRDIQLSLELGNYTAIATHDLRIIRESVRWARARGIAPELFEVQLLYGIRPGLQRDLVAEGLKVRVYVPFGRDWYPYFLRRLAERPANIAFILTSLLKR